MAPVVLHMVRKAVDVGVPELFARHQVWRALEDNSHLLWQLPFRFFLAGHANLGFCRDRTNQNANPNAKGITSQQIGSDTIASISPPRIAVRPTAAAWLEPAGIDKPPRVKMASRTQRRIPPTENNVPSAIILSGCIIIPRTEP